MSGQTVALATGLSVTTSSGPGGIILTEASDNIVTEAGDRLTTESSAGATIYSANEQTVIVRTS